MAQWVDLHCPLWSNYTPYILLFLYTCDHYKNYFEVNFVVIMKMTCHHIANPIYLMLLLNQVCTTTVTEARHPTQFGNIPAQTRLVQLINDHV